MKNNIQDINKHFFDSSKFSEGVIDNDYTTIQAIIDTLDALSRTCNLNVHIIDYNKQNFLYVSPNHLFLKYLTADSFKKMGFAFFEKYTSSQDYKFLKHINKEGFKFYNELSHKDRLKYTISYNFNLRLNPNRKEKILITLKFTPIILNHLHQIWLAMCVVYFAPKGISQEVEIKNLETSERLIYNRNSQKWGKENPIILTDKEISILRLSMQGYSNSDISDHMCLDINTVKFHKKNIFVKLNVNNIQEAITYSTNNKLI